MIYLVVYKRRDYERVAAAFDYTKLAAVVMAENGTKTIDKTYMCNNIAEFENLFNEFEVSCSLHGFIRVEFRWEKE